MGRVPLNERLNPFIKSPRQKVNDKRRLENQEALRINPLVAQRDRMMSGLPNAVKNNEFAQGVGDAAVDARNAAPTAAVLGGGALLTGGLLNAYSQQQQEGLPTGPLETLGRGAYNAVDAVGGLGGFGSDPFAEARNNLKTAGDELGSARVIEALAMDQIDAMEVIDEGMNQLHPEIAARVDATAQKLMQMPVESSDGTVRPYSPEKAYTDAIKIVEAEIRAGG